MDHVTPSVLFWIVSHCQNWNFYRYLLLHIWCCLFRREKRRKKKQQLLHWFCSTLNFSRKPTLFCVVSNAFNTLDSEIALCTCTREHWRLHVDPIWFKGSCDSSVLDETVGSVPREFVGLRVGIGKLECSSKPSQDLVQSTKARADTITLKKKREGSRSLSFLKHLKKWLKSRVLRPHQRTY